jgi:hypothetical protein
MTSMMLRDLTLGSLTPSVNTPFVLAHKSRPNVRMHLYLPIVGVHIFIYITNLVITSWLFVVT